ncbi:MAG: hypothetical protein ACOYMN_08640 [Roseimicrobium sp.]
MVWAYFNQRAANAEARRRPLAWGFLKRLGNGFSIDLRSLAAMRIGLALIVLWETGVALSNARLFLTDDGVLPRELLFAHHWFGQGAWSLHAWSGALEWQVVLLTCQALAAVCLLLGWRTWLANALCWVFICSLETRNPVLGNGSDAVVRLLLFWSLCLPLGARCSLDARAGKVAAWRGEIVSLPGACLLLQIAFVYWFSVTCNTDPAWWWGDGSALHRALSLDLYARPFGVWLRGYEGLCAALTCFTVWMEIVSPLIAFLPFWRTVWRLAAVGWFFLFHAGIAVSMNIGPFPYVMMVAWLAFLPKAFWERLMPERRVNLAAFVPAIGSFGRGLRLVKNAWCAACLAFVFMWNLRGTNFAYWHRYLPEAVHPLAFALRLDQYWGMFSPCPTPEDGWFVLRAALSDGTEVDLLRAGSALDWRKPALVSAAFKDERWQKYLMNLWLQTFSHLRPAFGNAIAREWNATHGTLNQVVAWQLWFMLERRDKSRDPKPTEPRAILLQEGQCLPQYRARDLVQSTSPSLH